MRQRSQGQTFKKTCLRAHIQEFYPQAASSNKRTSTRLETN